MALTYGPRLGLPSASGFSCWVKADASSTMKLEVRKAGTTAWQLMDTTATGTWDTADLRATGLDPRTRYEYRVLQDDVEVADAHTVTMPPDGGGDFLLLYVTDLHSTSSVQTCMSALRNYYDANLDAANTPVFIIFGGDMLDSQTTSIGSEDIANKFWTGFNLNGTGYQDIVSIIPSVQMFDDHDWAGNNSGKDKLPAYSTGTPYADAAGTQELLYPERPTTLGYRSIDGEDYWNFSFSHTVAGVPFIHVDQRAEKLFKTTTATPIINNQALNTLWQDDTKDWLRGELVRYADRGMVFWHHQTTFHAPITNPIHGVTSASRDGSSLYHQGDVWDVMRAARDTGLYGPKGNLVVLSGDDHWGKVGDWPLYEARDNDSANAAFPQPPAPGGSVIFREFKGVAGTAATLGSAEFGPGKLFSDNTTDFGIWFFNISSTNAGRVVQARVNYREGGGGSPYETVVTDTDGRVADYWYDNGVWLSYSATAVEVNQLYPPDNGNTGVTFHRWYMDDINGTMHDETGMGRDTWDQSLRLLADEDAPSADELRDGWDIRTEEELPMPE